MTILNALGKEPYTQQFDLHHTHQAKAFLRELFAVAVQAASADSAKFREHIPTVPQGRAIVVGAGKAAAAMAASFERSVKALWSAQNYAKLEGQVITRYGHGVACEKIKVIEAGHPMPDQAGEAAAREMIRSLSGLSADDLVICLISGGGSALLTAPADGIDFNEKKHINRQLLACGAAIGEINTVRKHLSKIKGGKLAQIASPAQVHTFVISDVPGDDVSVVASGPTLPDKSTCQHALEIISRYQIQVSSSTIAALAGGALETPKPHDELFAHHPPPVIISSAAKALNVAREFAICHGLHTLVLGDAIECEASELGKAYAHMTQWFAQHDEPLLAKPLLLLSGGETAVTLKQDNQVTPAQGRGGRNSEFLLSFFYHFYASHSHALNPIYALACDTDGIDGSEDNAGAMIASCDWELAQSLQLDAKPYLNSHDAYSYFASLNALIKTGPTLTNVNDFRAILIT